MSAITSSLSFRLLAVLASLSLGSLGVRAGLLDDLQKAKDDAKEKAQEAADEAKQKADDAAEQKAQNAADKTPQYDDQPAPTEGADRPTVAASSEAATAPAPDQLKPLPPREALMVELRSRGPNADNPSAPATDFPSSLRTLFVRVLEKKDTDFSCWVKLAAVEVPGVPPGQVIGTTPSAHAAGWNEEVGMDIFDESIALPRMLPPGRYRVDLAEQDPPYRVAASFPITVSAAASSAAEPFDLADPELGGLLEAATGEEGAGATWSYRLLMPDNDRVWEPVVPEGPDLVPAPLPWELVVSFFGRQSAQVSTVEITADSSDDAPRSVEIWGSSESATAGFTKLTGFSALELDAKLVVPVPSTPVRFLKIRLLTKGGDDATLRVTGVRVLEGHGAGYIALAQRFPELARWTLQPQHAAQAGLFFLQASAAEFQQQNSCIGCHVQSQALMGMSIAGQNEFVTSEAERRRLIAYIRRSQLTGGCFARSPDLDQNQVDDQTNTALCALGLSYGHRTEDDAQGLLRGGLWLATQQQDDGSIVTSDEREPVTQGLIFQTSNCLDAWAEALKQGDNPKLRAALVRALAYIEKADAVTTQDKVFKVLAFVRHGDEAQKKLAHQLCAELLQQQQPDGGWLIDPSDKDPGSRPFATGEVLYALRVAGTNVHLSAFQRGVRWLISEQRPDGAWESLPCATQFASTMWPVIALVGSFTTTAEPAHIVVSALPRPKAPPPAAGAATPLPPPPATVPDHIELILDCSYSMHSRLGDSTRLDTARAVLHNLIAKLPDNASVGLRLYGHRFESVFVRSYTDTELVVPIQRLNRSALFKQIDSVNPRGQTPLVYSTLQAAEDLKTVGGGTIVLVTDGEESCGGKPREAGPKIAGLGVPVRLFIIGFTLKGKRIANDLMAFAQPTGGRYFIAADGPQLAAALSSAVSTKAPVVAPPPAPEIEPPPALPDLPYEVFDATGGKVAAGSTLDTAGADVKPGSYRVVVHDGAKTIALDDVRTETGETAELYYSPGEGILKRVK